jgi:cyanate permease
MWVETFLQVLGVLALAFSVLSFGYRLQVFNRLRRPDEAAPPKGNTAKGIVYAYTLGMMPWAKESTRRHMLAYLRGVGFHIGIFYGLALFLLSPWIAWLPQSLITVSAFLMAAGALLGLAGLAMRFIQPDLRSITTPDDLFAVVVVSLFQAAAAFWLAGLLPAGIFYLVGALMLVYAPFGKIRHCIYFAYSRWFYGKFIGSRALLPHSQQGGK